MSGSLGWKRRKEIQVMKKWLCFAAMMMAAAGPVLADDVEIVPMTVGKTPNVSAYGETVFFAGQPDAESFALFAEMGVEKVINLRSESEMAGLDFDESEVVAKAGMEYVNIDVCKEGSRIELTEAVMDELDKTPAKKTLVHCASSNRVGYVWSVYRGVRHGLPVDDAIAEGKKAGLRSPVLEERARDFIADAAGKS